MASEPSFDPRKNVIIGSTAISKQALEADVRLLMLGYQKKQKYDFSAFAETWKEYNFSLIHFACPEKNGRETFMQALFQIVLSYLSTAKILEFKLAAVYSLYLLYYTQPEVWEKVRIRVNKGIYESLMVLYKNCAETAKIHDVVYCLWRMRSEDAFAYSLNLVGAENTVDIGGEEEHTVEKGMENLEKEVVTSDLAGLADAARINSLSNLSARYQTLKRSLLQTPQAAIASRSVLSVAGIRDPDPEMVQRMMMASPFAMTAVAAESSEDYGDEFVGELKSTVDRFRSGKLGRIGGGSAEGHGAFGLFPDPDSFQQGDRRYQLPPPSYPVTRGAAPRKAARTAAGLSFARAAGERRRN